MVASTTDNIEEFLNDRRRRPEGGGEWKSIKNSLQGELSLYLKSDPMHLSSNLTKII
jgi:hypothetical protein